MINSNIVTKNLFPLKVNLEIKKSCAERNIIQSCKMKIVLLFLFSYADQLFYLTLNAFGGKLELWRRTVSLSSISSNALRSTVTFLSLGLKATRIPGTPLFTLKLLKSKKQL